MSAIKVNLYVSCAPADKPVADRLMEWLYSMRDEVNLWYNDPPRKLEPLPLSWRLLLPWYHPVDPRVLYAETLAKRRENAHIYIFLTSASSLADNQWKEEVLLALNRRAECEREDLAPLVLPLAVASSAWQKESRLAKFEPLAKGIPLSGFSNSDEGYLMVTEQIAALVKTIQVRLNETRHFFAQSSNGSNIRPVTNNTLPYLGDNPEQFDFNPPKPFRPPDWLGWSLIALIFALSAGSFRKNHPAVSSLHLKARPENAFEVEYPSKQPMMPPPANEEIVLPPVE